MPKKKKSLRTLLLQIRDETRVRQEEYDSFVNYSGLSKEQIDILNVFDTPNFLPKIIDKYDALFVGGASEASVLEPDKYKFVKSGEELLLYCIDKEIPVFASCFGFQLAVTALGGMLMRDEKDFEMGVIPISLTAEAKKDPLFRDTPNPFSAIAVHRERTLKAPGGCEVLAYTDLCVHSFRLKEKPFWTFQFHPEVDKATLIERLTIYKDKYTENDEHLEEILANVRETPESNNIIKKFVDRILVGE